MMETIPPSLMCDSGRGRVAIDCRRVSGSHRHVACASLISFFWWCHVCAPASGFVPSPGAPAGRQSRGGIATRPSSVREKADQLDRASSSSSSSAKVTAVATTTTTKAKTVTPPLSPPIAVRHHQKQPLTTAPPPVPQKMPKPQIKTPSLPAPAPPAVRLSVDAETGAARVSALGETVLSTVGFDGEEDARYRRVASYGARTTLTSLASACGDGAFEPDPVGGGAFVTFAVSSEDDNPRKLARFDVDLGLVHPGARTLALSRVKRWWMGPAASREVPLETQLLALEIPLENRATNLYVLALPLLSDDGTFRCTLWDAAASSESSSSSESPTSQTNKPIALRARCESGDASVATDVVRGAVWLGAAESSDASACHDLVERGLEAASFRKNGRFGDDHRVETAFRTLKRKAIPREKLVEGLAWCTWDACYSAVTAKKIDAGLRSLKQAGVTARRLIIDDGWAQLDRDPKAEHTTHDEGGALMSGETLTGLAVGENAAQYLYDLGSGDSSSFWRHVTVAVQKWVASEVGKLYSKLVEHGSDDSFPVRLWRLCATKTPLRTALVEFYDEQTDFTRRLAWPPRPHETKFGGPDGFRSFVKDVVKSEHGVKSVVCWHAVAGNWGGVAPRDNYEDCDAQYYDTADEQNSAFQGVPPAAPLRLETIASVASPHLRFVEPSVAWDPASLKGMTTPTQKRDIDALYDGLYSRLAALGVDGVKADAQSGVGPLGSRHGGGPKSAGLFARAMETAADKYFSTTSTTASSSSRRHHHHRQTTTGKTGHPLSHDEKKGVAVTVCMSHSTENLYRYATSAIARASDDFYPRDPDSWAYHLTACAFNSLLVGGLAVPDFDMFQTRHPAAWLHAAARAASGGPVTVSDEVGSHDADVLRALATPDGRTFVARAPARLAADCLFSDVTRDRRTPLKTVAPNAGGLAVVGVFNVQGSRWDRRTRRYVADEDDADDDENNMKLAATLRPRDALPAFRHPLVAADDDAARAAADLSRDDALFPVQDLSRESDVFFERRSRHHPRSSMHDRGGAPFVALAWERPRRRTSHNGAIERGDATSPSAFTTEEEDEEEDAQARRLLERTSEERRVVDFRQQQRGDAHRFELARGEFRVFSLARLRGPPGRQWAPLGLEDKLNAGGALVDVVDLPDGDAELGVMDADGAFVVFADAPPAAVYVDGAEWPRHRYDARSKLLFVDLEATGSRSDDERVRDLHIRWGATAL